MLKFRFLVILLKWVGSLDSKMKEKQFIITKKIAKHGKPVIIIVPRILEQHLKPGTVAELTIKVIDGVNKNE